MLTLDQRKDILERLNSHLAQAGPIEGFRIVDDESHEVIIQYGDCTEEQRASVDAALAGFDWDATPRVTKMTPLEFLDRLPFASQLRIQTAEDSQPAVKLLLKRLMMAVEIDVMDQRTIDGVAALQQFGIITQEEANALLA